MISPTIEDALALPLPFACAFMAVFGAVIGSFLNVVIHRLPREQSIVFPKSTCPSCRAPIRAYDNIPILSFLILRGRCRKCGAKISARYPAVEALVALLFAAVTWHDGLSFALPFDLAFTAAVVALIFIDAEHMILPNAITYPGILFALITRVAVPYLAGASHFDDLPQLQSLLPPQYPLWLVSLIGAAIGALAGIAMMIRRGSRNLQMMLPFGIFLGIGSIISLLIGTRIIDWYASQFH